MSLLIVLTMSTVLATFLILSSVRAEARRQEWRQKSRLHSSNDRFEDNHELSGIVSNQTKQ